MIFMCKKNKKMFMMSYPDNKKMKEWRQKSEEEQWEIAEKNDWNWCFLWGDIANSLRYDYEQVDKDPQVEGKYGGYDGWNKEPKKGEEYAPCTNKDCPYYDTVTWGEDRYKGANCSYWGDTDRMFECHDELFVLIQKWIDVCGIEALNELQVAWDIHPDIIGWFKYGDDYFKDKEGYNMKENMKYIYEKGIIKDDKKITKTINKGHDTGAILSNQYNCEKFNLIDNTLTNFKNKKEYDDCCYTDYDDITYIRAKEYGTSHQINGKAIKGIIKVKREGYEFTASNKCGKEKLFFHVDSLVELEVHFKDNSYKHLKCWGLVDNDDDYLVVYDPRKELEDQKTELCNQIKEINDKISKMESFNETLNLMEKIYDEEDCIIEHTSTDIDHFGVSPPDNEEYYAMIEFFSTHLVMKDEKEYEGDFGPNTKFVKDAMKLIDDTYKRADEIKEKYKDQNVKVTIGEFNNGCEGGMALYVWVPYQNK